MVAVGFFPEYGPSRASKVPSSFSVKRGIDVLVLLLLPSHPPMPCWLTRCLSQDTRPHSPKLAALALLGIRAVGGEGLDQGILTTPMLHHCVRCPVARRTSFYKN